MGGLVSTNGEMLPSGRQKRLLGTGGIRKLFDDDDLYTPALDDSAGVINRRRLSGRKKYSTNRFTEKHPVSRRKRFEYRKARTSSAVFVGKAETLCRVFFKSRPDDVI